MMGVSTGNQMLAEQRQPQVVMALRELETATDTLSQAVDILESKLADVLSSATPPTTSPLAKGAAELFSLASAILGQATKAMFIADRINQVVERIELSIENLIAS